jgi:hypothetical protein
MTTTSIWIAYYVSKHDSHLVYEDGLGFVARGATKEEAEAKAQRQFRDEIVGPSITPEEEEEFQEILAEHRLHSMEI